MPRRKSEVQSEPGIQQFPTPGEAKPAWEIFRVDEVSSFNQQGPVTLEQATVRIANGTTFTVSVPRSPGWSDALKKAAADHAAELYDVLGATSNEYINP